MIFRQKEAPPACIILNLTFLLENFFIFSEKYVKIGKKETYPSLTLFYFVFTVASN